MSKVFKPRTTAPGLDNKNYIKTTHGGYNYCKLINDKTGSVMPNCVGYAWGRAREILGKFHELSRGNAEVWWGKNDGYVRSQKPKVPSIICWKQGSAGSGNDGAGHVAVVEAIDADGTITISNSAYKGTNFYMRKMKPPYNYAKGFILQGFIHLPGDYTVEPITPPKPDTPKLSNDKVADLVILGRYGNGQARKDKLKAEGYDPVEIQRLVDIKLGKKPKPPVTPPNKKANAEIAAEVKLGRWGNGAERKDRLTKAGYNYDEIQALVNSQNGSTKPKLSNEQVADKVIRGEYGNGKARKDKLKAEGYDPDVIQSIVNRKTRK